MAGANHEFDLIARIRARAGTRDDVLLGIGDDAAILRVPAGHDLVVSTDTLNIGVHFPADTAPSDIGWKALAVNLSDLAAMGARPAWCTLNLCLPEPASKWLDAFLDGFLELAVQHDVALVGGDTTRGPLSITVTVHGFVPHGAALLRSGAQVGDDVWVSGTLGDAAAGLALLSPSPIGVSGCADEPSVRASANATAPGAMAGVREGVRGNAERGLARFAPHLNHTPALALGARALIDPRASGSPPDRFAPTGEEDQQLRTRLDRPTPRVELGLALRGIASACIDVSDGLLADLGHVLAASDVGAEVDVATLPASPALMAAFDETSRIPMQLGGGDDYELCFTASPALAEEVIAAAASADVEVRRIGRIEAQAGLRLRDDDGSVRDVSPIGYRHFDASRDEGGCA